jgi:hypothetical protein
MLNVFFSQNSSSSSLNTLIFLNDFIDVNSSLVVFPQYSVGFLSGIAGESINLQPQIIVLKKFLCLFRLMTCSSVP